MKYPTPSAALAARLVSVLLALALPLLGGCFEIEPEDALPVARAGEDQSYPDDVSARVTLDGTDSEDPDGEIVEYQWRYTGDPRGEARPEPGPDAGIPEDPFAALGFEPRPDFCPEVDLEEQPWVTVPDRWCLLKDSDKAKLTLELPTGVHRFTLWVTDDDGNVAADSVIVHVGDTPYTPAVEH